MSSLRPVAVYGLTVPAGDEPIPAFDAGEYPATFKLTMAALDPFEKIEEVEGETPFSFKGATLRIIRVPSDDSDDEESDDDEYDMANLLDGVNSEEDDDEDLTGGPSESGKSNKARAVKLLKEALANGDSMDVDAKASPKGKGKGKGKAVEEEEEEDDEDDESDDEDFDGPEEFVLCTLDPTKNYQQTLDITINEHEQVYFQVTGTHSIFLTGNIMIPEEGDDFDSEDGDEEDEGYDLSPDDDELDLPGDEDESDELDDLDDSRITEVTDEDVEAPKLVEAKKGKNKRAAPESDVDDSMTVDDLLEKSLKAVASKDAPINGEKKLSKKQQKKLKANSGSAVEAPATPAAEDVGTKVADTKPSPGKSDKKVQFAKTLVQGPSSSTATPEAVKTKAAEKPKTNGEKPAKASAGPKVVQGVTIDDKKTGTGPAAKKGDKVSMRYIGKLEKDKKVFDSNKKGKPFTFQLGKGDVIKGWDIGVVGMSVGGERRITIPASLAYGSQKLDGIPANSTLIFDLKVLEIK